MNSNSSLHSSSQLNCSPNDDEKDCLKTSRRTCGSQCPSDSKEMTEVSDFLSRLPQDDEEVKLGVRKAEFQSG